MCHFCVELGLPTLREWDGQPMRLENGWLLFDHPDQTYVVVNAPATGDQ